MVDQMTKEIKRVHGMDCNLLTKPNAYNSSRYHAGTEREQDTIPH